MKTKARGLKKAFAVIMALAVVLSYSMVPTFAAETATMTVGGIDAGAVAKAYKIVTMNKNGSTDVVGTYSIVDVDHPTPSEITTIASAVVGTTADKTATANAEKKAVFENVSPGMYLILVENGTNPHAKIYNPVIVSIKYDEDGNAVANEYDVENKKYNTGKDNETDAWVKSQEPSIDKKISRSSDDAKRDFAAGETNPENSMAHAESGKGDTAGKGDKVVFDIDTKIPTYADNYKNFVFTISDVLSSGLQFNDDVKVYVDGTEVTKSATTWTQGTATGKTFTVELASDYIKANMGKEVKVVYSATIKNDCKENFDPETNKADLTYTNGPGENQTANKEDTPTYHYTFTINGKIKGDGSDSLKEAVKVGTDKTGKQVFKNTERFVEQGFEYKNGAEFALYRANQGTGTGANFVVDDAEKNNPHRTAKSETVNGQVGILTGLERLDAGTYYLIETKAPEGYAVVSTPVEVKIEAWFNEDGTLNRYQIKFNDVVGGDYTWNYKTNTYTQADKVTYTDSEGEEVTEDEIADIRNSKVGTLPSTGGMGTVLFTVAGIALMAIAAGLFMASRRRNAEEE